MKAKYFIYLGLGMIFLSLIMMVSNVDNIVDSISDKMKYERKELEVDPVNIEKIVTATFNSNVILLPTDSDKIKITYYENKYIKYNHQTEGNILTFEGKKTSSSPFRWLLFWGNKTITIEIPNNLVLNYYIKTSNGRMEAHHLEVADLEFRTSNSSIEISDMESQNDIIMYTSNGSVYFKDIKADDMVDIRTSNGSIDLNNVVSKIIKGNSSNGKIVFKGITSNDITLRTSNGRIDGTVVGINGDYAKYMRTSNGHVTIDGSRVDKNYQTDKDKNKKINFSTSNGSIELEFRN